MQHMGHGYMLLLLGWKQLGGDKPDSLYSDSCASLMCPVLKNVSSAHGTARAIKWFIIITHVPVTHVFWIPHCVLSLIGGVVASPYSCWVLFWGGINQLTVSCKLLWMYGLCVQTNILSDIVWQCPRLCGYIPIRFSMFLVSLGGMGRSSRNQGMEGFGNSPKQQESK